MKKICVLTATRAEYGLLKNLIKGLKKEDNFDLRVVVTGAHLEIEYGNTLKEIQLDGVEIDKEIPILEKEDTTCMVSHAMGNALKKFADYFSENKFDLLIVLGDRYETIAVCLAAMNERIPIAHLHGGEKTEGAIDEGIRHAITKLSYLHFTATEEYRNRVIQLGEEPNRVFNVGAMSVENIITQKLLSKKELEKELDFTLGENFAVVTFHPVTLETETIKAQVEALADAMFQRKDMNYIVTKSNADAGGKTINCLWKDFENCNSKQMKLVGSLGMCRYLSALKHCRVVIGNSSSGITEAPLFGVPTVNVGERQKGRIRLPGIIDCEPNRESIAMAIEKTFSQDLIEQIKQQTNPYGDGHTSDKIIQIIKHYLLSETINLKKRFHDIY